VPEARRVGDPHRHARRCSTHRRGIGRAILVACEDAARKAGFARVELMATMAGAPFYRACGYRVIEPSSSMTSIGVRIPLLRMGKGI
jgi:predicted N-acetyltransferase YhbS